MAAPRGSTPVGPLGRPWLLSALVLVGGLLGLSMVLDGVLEGGDLAALDPGITAGWVAERTPTVTAIAQFFTFLGSAIGIGVLFVALVAWIALRQRDRRLAVLIAGSMAVSLALTIVMKDLVGRERPPADIVAGNPLGSFAFPSGHTLNSTVFFGLVALLIMAKTQSIAAQIGIGLAWLAVSVLVALSRVYLGFHWMTDVIGGFAAGSAVLGATVLFPHLIRDRHLVAAISPFRDDALERRAIRGGAA